MEALPSTEKMTLTQPSQTPPLVVSSWKPRPPSDWLCMLIVCLSLGVRVGTLLRVGRGFSALGALRLGPCLVHSRGAL